MCLFVGYLPLEGSLRVLDVFCLEGKKALFQVALAIFKVNMDEILDENDNMTLIKMIKENPLTKNPYKEILRVAFEEFDHVIVEDTSELSLRFQAIKTLEDNNKVSQLFNLKSTTHYSTSELENIHQKFHSLIPVTATVAAISFESFKQLFTQLAPVGFIGYLHSNDQTYSLLWKKTRSSAEDDHVEFSQFVSNLSKLCNDSLEDRVDFLLELFDTNDDLKINKNELCQVVDALISLFNKQETPPRIASFVDMIFDQIEESNELSSDSTPTEMMISFPILKRELIDNCKLTGMFSLEATAISSSVSATFGRISRARSNTII